MSGIIIQPDHHILILGRTGQGKTYTTKNVFLPALLKQKNNYIVIMDTKGEYRDTTPNVARSPKELNYMLYGDDEPQIEGPTAIRIEVSEPSEALAEEYLRAAWSPFQDVQMGAYTPKFGVRFFLEDAPVFYDSAYLTPPQLKKWITMGRGPQRVLTVTSQRGQLISKTVLCMVEHLFIFRVSEYDGKRVIREYYGDKAAYAVSAIPKYGYVLISDLYDEPLTFDPYQPKVKPTQPEGIEI